MYITQTDSTNRLLKDYLSLAVDSPLPAEELRDGFYITTDYQTAGRGQVGNHWESEAGQNLLVSILIRPKGLAVEKQFRLSMIASLSVVEAVNGCTMHDARCTIKWPNDIYYKEKKVGGILIENRLSGGNVTDCIFGLGLNINQTVFKSDAPNPVSLRQITGKETDRQELLEAILTRLNELKEWLTDDRYPQLKERYIQHLFRKEGVFEYEDEGGRFKAQFKDIDEHGRLVLERRRGTAASSLEAEIREYLFKQVKYVVNYEL